MKTLCFSLLLLLVVVFYCDAMPQAVQQGKGGCCSGFESKRIPIKKIVSITKTHIACPRRGFKVKTDKGKLFCYKQTFEWAQNVYNQLHETEGSGQRN